MTAKPINLTRARKSRARDAEKRVADANAAKHGRTKADRLRNKITSDRAKADLDGHERDPDQAPG